MRDKATIRVTDIIGSSLCISAEDGQKIFEKLEPLLEHGTEVTVSFERITTMISLFLNAAVGQLYRVFDEKQINDLVRFEGLADDDREMLRRVADNAKRYYADPRRFDHAWEMEGSDEE